MKKIYQFMLMVALLLSATIQLTAQVNGEAAKPIVSTAEKPVFYYIESASDGVEFPGRNYLGNLMYAPNADNGVLLKHDKKEDIIATSIDISNALWIIVSEDGVTKLRNKGTGLYLDGGKFGKTSTVGFTTRALNEPTTQYAIKSNDGGSNTGAWNFGSGNVIDRYNTNKPNSVSAWFFIVEPESEANYKELLRDAYRADLLAKIESTQEFLDNTSEGNSPGQFTAASREALKSAIDDAATVYSDPSASIEDYIAAIEKLNEALAIYLDSGVKPIISDDVTTKWYFLQGTRPENSYLTNTGAGEAILNKSIIPDDTQLWKFVKNTNGTANGLAMVNKATNEFLDADTEYNNPVYSVADMPTNNLQLILSDIYTDKVARFWIEHAEGSEPKFRLHAGNTGVLNWNGNAYDHSSWLILDYSDALRDFLLASINKSYAALGTVSEGIVYTEENQEKFKLIVVDAEVIYNNPEATDEELIIAKAKLDEAFVEYLATADIRPELLLSANPLNDRWYWIRSTSTHAYASQKVISAGTRNVGEKFTFENKTASQDDKQLFRVELTEDNTKIKSLINKAGETYMAANGAISETEIADNDFTLLLLSDGVSLNIKPTSLNAIHAQQSGSHIVNWAGDAGSASAWSFDFALEIPKTPTYTQDLLDNTCVVRVNDGVITVDGAAEFDVYSIAGQKVNHKAKLLSGIYIVKVNDFTKKVIVK